MSDAIGRKINSFKTQYSEAQNALVMIGLDGFPARLYFIEAKGGNAHMTVPVVIAR